MKEVRESLTVLGRPEITPLSVTKLEALVPGKKFILEGVNMTHVDPAFEVVSEPYVSEYSGRMVVDIKPVGKKGALPVGVDLAYLGLVPFYTVGDKEVWVKSRILDY